MMRIQEVLSKNVKALRTKKGLSQQRLSEKVDMCQAAIQRIEYGTRWPRPDTINALAEAFNVDETELFKDGK